MTGNVTRNMNISRIVSLGLALVAPGSSQQPSLAPAPAVNFTRAVSYFTGGIGAGSLAIGDVNGDSKIDAVVANGGSSSIGVLLGNGNGSFRPGVALRWEAAVHSRSLSAT